MLIFVGKYQNYRDWYQTYQQSFLIREYWTNHRYQSMLSKSSRKSNINICASSNIIIATVLVLLAIKIPLTKSQLLVRLMALDSLDNLCVQLCVYHDAMVACVSMTSLYRSAYLKFLKINYEHIFH